MAVPYAAASRWSSTAAIIAGLAFMWWPRTGTYRPIQPYEGGTLTQAAASTTAALARPAPSDLRVGSYGHIVTGWSKTQKLPTAEHPQLALVLVPRDPGRTSTPAPAPARTAPRPTPGRLHS